MPYVLSQKQVEGHQVIWKTGRDTGGVFTPMTYCDSVCSNRWARKVK